MVPGRLGLLLTLLLVLVNLSNSVTATMPRSEFLAPLVLWIWLSVLFVTLALAEYTVILMVLKFSGRKVEHL
jgi:ABC-type iron transport system FetAB permease component